MSREYTPELAAALAAYLEARDYPYSFDQEEGIIRLSIRTESCFSMIHFLIYLREDCFTSYAIVDPLVRENRRLEVAEFMTRVNYGMIFGDFELGMDNGEIRFRVTVNVDSTVLSDELVDASLETPVYIFDVYGDELLNVMLGMESAKDAVNFVNERQCF